jgi:hypothetical protein
VRSRTLIFGGLALCLGLFTWPAWHAIGAPPPAQPNLVRPANATTCVAETKYMRASHMVLLRQWRDAVVRTGVRTYTTADGQSVRMSLTGTCIRACHTDRSKFCDRCHNYAGVAPTCWNCHVEQVSRPVVDNSQWTPRDPSLGSPVRQFASSQVAPRGPQ